MYRPTPTFLGALVAFVLVAGLLAAATASATVVSVTWTNPTTRTDGVALPAAELRGTRVQRGTCSAPGVFGTSQGEVLAAAGASTTSFDLGPGVYCFRAFARASGVSGFVESAASATATRTIEAADPNPPTGLATTAPVAFDLTRRGALGRMVGVVPIGTPCVPGEPIIAKGQTYYEVPETAVTLFREPRDTKLVAVCAAV